MSHRIIDELRGRNDRRGPRETRQRRSGPDGGAPQAPLPVQLPSQAQPPPQLPSQAPMDAPPPFAAQGWPPPATSIPMPAQATLQNVQMPQVQLPGAYGTRPPEFAPPQPVSQATGMPPPGMNNSPAPAPMPPPAPPLAPPSGKGLPMQPLAPSSGKGQPMQPPQPQSLQGNLSGAQMQSAQDRIAAARAQAQARIASVQQR